MKTPIREYAEGEEVEIVITKPWMEEHKDVGERIVIVAKNEGGYNQTDVDLLDLLDFLGISISVEKAVKLKKQIEENEDDVENT